MNLSGFPVVRLLNYYKVDIKDVLVIFDDMSLEAGSFRLRSRGSSGGHRGIESIIAQTGTENISRLKIGIGACRFADAKDYVLGRFSEEEMAEMAKVFNTAKEAALFWAINGIAKTMNRFNAQKTAKDTQEVLKKDLDA